MNQDPELDDLLQRELTRVPAPDFLWTRVAAALHRPAPQPALWRNVSWAAGAFVLLALLLSLQWTRHRQNETLDLGDYIEAVQQSPASSSLAIYRTPENFAAVASFGQPASLAGYRVVEQRMTSVHGEPVQQMILNSGANSVALFITPPRLRLDAGRNSWVEDQLAGVKCKRLDCPRVRTVQFPCAKANCILVCKACGEEAMQMLLTALTQ